MPTGLVTFRRQVCKEFPSWHTSDNKLSDLHVTSEGTIEDDGTEMLQVSHSITVGFILRKSEVLTDILEVPTQLLMQNNN